MNEIWRGIAVEKIAAGELGNFLIAPIEEQAHVVEQLAADTMLFGIAYELRVSAPGLVRPISTRLNPTLLVIHKPAVDHGLARVIARLRDSVQHNAVLGPSNATEMLDWLGVLS